MSLHTIPAGDPYQRPFRIGAVVVVMLLLGILFVSAEPDKFGVLTLHLLGWSAVAIVVATIIAANVLSALGGLWELKRKYSVEVTDGKLIQRRAGSAVTEIPLDKITCLQERRGWLIARSGEPEKKIAIPREISDFSQLRRELATYRTVTPMKSRVSFLSYFMLVFAAVAYFLLFTSHRHSVIRLSGATALILQAWAIISLRPWRVKRKSFVLLLAAFYVGSVLNHRLDHFSTFESCFLKTTSPSQANELSRRRHLSSAGCLSRK